MKKIKTFDDWMESIPEDERDKIALPEVWNAAVDATFDALIEEACINEDYRIEWTRIKDKLQGRY